MRPHPPHFCGLPWQLDVEFFSSLQSAGRKHIHLGKEGIWIRRFGCNFLSDVFHVCSFAWSWLSYVTIDVQNDNWYTRKLTWNPTNWWFANVSPSPTGGIVLHVRFSGENCIKITCPAETKPRNPWSKSRMTLRDDYHDIWKTYASQVGSFQAIFGVIRNSPRNQHLFLVIIFDGGQEILLMYMGRMKSILKTYIPIGSMGLSYISYVPFPSKIHWWILWVAIYKR